ncbi:urease accessory protein UreD [Aquabacterium sp. J223]|uniref:urease accessory protein UreD n=1 Tax=Aquabacterium sp. J223 TaxID=2898431 RepID=UPI0021ADD8E6|nr:urease accessory protein UreD [Aquabacterium sp. J223]UUX95580.1 urease accessory protein UreD [Aquabacterium sp. J223]
MTWHGHLRLDYRLADGRTVGHDRHDGPLRVLQRLYPEGPAVCHQVLVHPPGGLAGGDELDVELSLTRGSHALLTTPGATRFYRSKGPLAVQRVNARLADGARLEWLPLETIAFDGCRAENRLSFDLAPGAEMMGWDVLALGLPASDAAFRRGQVLQDVRLPGAWLERGLIDAADHRLLDGPLGWAGQRALGMLWFGAGAPIDGTRRQALLDTAREAGHDAVLDAGCTSPNDRVVVLRVLGPRVEPVMQRLLRTRAAWRRQAWDLAACAPRVWRT